MLKKLVLYTMALAIIYTEGLIILSGYFDWKLFNQQNVCLKGANAELNCLGNFLLVFVPILSVVGGASYLDIKEGVLFKKSE